MVTLERLRELLDYDEGTGVFEWKVSQGRSRRGSVAGTVWVDKKSGLQYRRIMIDGRIYSAHRLAWLYVFGSWPTFQVDHRDGDGLNNRRSNLREATGSQNMQNRGAYSNNTSGFKGVCWDKESRKWKAQIGSQGRLKSLGRFDDPSDAHAAYCDAAEKLHGDFGRTA